MGDFEPPAPMVPAEPLSKDESKVALGIVATFLVLALGIALWGVTRIGANTDLGLGSPPRTEASPSAGSPTTSGSASPSPNAADLEELAILGADGYDPFGDKTENNKDVPKVFDGDPDTEWTSEGYKSANLGGLKRGVGVVVDLGPNKNPREIRLQMSVPADVTVYLNSEKSLDGSTKVGSKKDAEGTVTFPVSADAKGQYVIIWFTSLTKDGKGDYRAHLGEVTVLG